MFLLCKKCNKIYANFEGSRLNLYSLQSPTSARCLAPNETLIDIGALKVRCIYCAEEAHITILTYASTATDKYINRINKLFHKINVLSYPQISLIDLATLSAENILLVKEVLIPVDIK